MQYILAIDQGTSSTKAILFNERGEAFARGSEPLRTLYLDAGFVEQQPQEIIQNVLQAVAKCLADFSAKGGQQTDIKAIGVSNQRETFVLWDKAGNPLHNAVVWQCKRSVNICQRLKVEGLEETIRQNTGLLIDPYFSGTKLMWLYENDERIRIAIDEKKAYFGTIDTWLLYRFTNGKSYYTDYTNASRTLFFNLHTLSWDGDLLTRFGLAKLHLPEARPSAALFGETNLNGLLSTHIPIAGMIGDSHAAAFGEGCFASGTAKATLGTGCSILMNIGSEPKPSKNGMVTTICWSTEDQTTYALEGVIVTCGATIEWLKNELGLFANSLDTEAMAVSVPDNGGVYLIPAFSGLGAPHWDMNRKAALHGLTFDTTKNHIVRAALESIPYQIKDVVVAMEGDAGNELQQLLVDGGITANSFVMHFLAGLLKKPIMKIGMPDISALGAAYMAGLKAGVYESIEQLKTLNSNRSLVSSATNEMIDGNYEEWKRLINGDAV